ncbi:hypothetical protein TNCV_1691291 [Trichonephila clavipes]|nr:hypothetical protein TNCV_1691291 [Trichonephila clavipes]
MPPSKHVTRANKGDETKRQLPLSVNSQEARLPTVTLFFDALRMRHPSDAPSIVEQASNIVSCSDCFTFLVYYLT